VALTLVIAGAAAASASGYPAGALDPTFGGDGIVVTDAPGGIDFVGDVAVQRDGKIVVSAIGTDWGGLIRYRRNGRRDRTFGTDGFSENASAGRVAVLRDGSIVASCYGLGVARFRPNGRLDRRFAVKGTARAVLAGTGRAIAVQSDGSYVVAGSYELDGGGTNVAVARFRPGGRLDARFGDGGIARLPFAGEAPAVALDRKGKILIAGVFNVHLTRDDLIPLVRLGHRGRVDRSFGVGGVASVPSAPPPDLWDLALDSRGRIVASGYSGVAPEFGVVVRVTGGGRGDRRFGKRGAVVLRPHCDPCLARAGVTAFRVALLSTGKMLVAGIVNDGDRDPPHRIGIYRLRADGRLDPGFGNSGRIKIRAPRDGGAWTHGLAVQRDGKAIVAAQATGGRRSHAVVARVVDARG
jgi:uncharacterized delta-60 repeat protein